MAGFVSETSVQVNDGQHAFDGLRAFIQKQGLSVSEDGEREFTVSFRDHRIEVERRDNRLSILVDARTERSLDALRGLVVTQLADAAPGVEAGVEWTGYRVEEGIPKGFRTLTVLHAEEVFPGMMRVVFSADDLGAYVDDGNHFALLLQENPSREPVWPYRRRNGRTVWPEGEDTLVRRLYTIRHLNVEDGEFAVDFVLHGHGKAAEWARSAEAGDSAAMIGPVGRHLELPEGPIFLGGDLTALPNIGRMLETVPDGARGHVLLRAPETVLDSGYLPETPLTVSFVPEDVSDDAYIARVREICDAERPEFAWFAGERQTALPLRAYFRDDLELDRQQFFSVPYWSREAVGE